MSPSPTRSSSTTSQKKRPIIHSGSPEVPISELQAPPPVQVTSASTYSSGGDDDPQPDDQQESDEVDDDYPALETEHNHAQAANLLSPSTFEPLFALITDPQTKTTHHPSVYYVFSDDAENEREGHDVATIAAIKALDHTQPAYQQTSDDRDDESDEERYIILDLEPTSVADDFDLHVSDISSLSPSWAITATNIRPAPTFDEDINTTGAHMLSIEGIEIADTTYRDLSTTKDTKSKQQTDRRAATMLQEARKRGGGSIIDGMSDLFGQFSKGMAVLDKVNRGRPPEHAER